MSSAAAQPHRLSPSVAAPLLVLACLLWGISFPLMPIAVRPFDTVSPEAGCVVLGAMFNGWRFGVAGVVAAVLIGRRWGRATRRDLRGGLIVGVFAAAGMFCQVLGLTWVVPSVSGMITALPVVLAPAAQALILRRAVGVRIWSAALAALSGCMILALGAGAAVSDGSRLLAAPFPYAGEVLTVGAACCFTAQILAVDRYVHVGNAACISALSFIVMGLVNVAVVVPFGGLSALPPSAVVRAAGQSAAWLPAFAVLVFGCSIGANGLMNLAQSSVSPASAAVIYTTEPLFALVFSLCMGQEQLTAWTLLGGGLIIAGALAASVRRARPEPPAVVAPGRSVANRR